MERYSNDSLAQEEMTDVSGMGEDAEFDATSSEWDSIGVDKCNLIVNYLPHDVDDASLKTIFVEHGELVAAKVVKDKSTKKSLGYGFVKYLRYEDACDAIQQKNGMMIGHKRLKVSIARPPSDDIRNCKLYVTNLPKDYSQREVTSLFAQYGEIIECRVLKDRNAKSNRGVAFVQFNLRAQANHALSLNGYRPPGSDRSLVVKYAEEQHKRGDRRGVFTPSVDDMNRHGHFKSHEMQTQQQPYYYPYARNQNNYSRQQVHVMQPHSLSPNMFMQPNMMYQQHSPQTMPMRHNASKTGAVLNMPEIPSMSSTMRGMDSSWYTAMIPAPYDNRAPAMHNIQMNGSASSDNMIDYSLGVEQENSDTSSAHIKTQQMMSSGSKPIDQSLSYGNSISLIISNLPPYVDVALLQDLLAPYGRISSAQIDIVDSTQLEDGSESIPSRGVCLGRGHVIMSGMKQAQHAQKALHGATIFEGGLPLQVVIAGNNRTLMISQENSPSNS